MKPLKHACKRDSLKPIKGSGVSTNIYIYIYICVYAYIDIYVYNPAGLPS